MHRLNWIDARVRIKAFPNCKDIVEQFCISRRQAARDVEYLRDSMGAPIEYCRIRKGYYFTQDTFVLGHIMVTDAQRQGLAYLAEYRRVEGGVSAFAKLDLTGFMRLKIISLLNLSIRLDKKLNSGGPRLEK